MVSQDGSGNENSERIYLFKGILDLLSPRCCPQLAALLQVLTLLQLLPPDVAAHHRLAVMVDSVGEVLAGFQQKSLNPICV